jgi:mannose-6-phosphate isomerase-like protein (cupin superfamily)
MFKHEDDRRSLIEWGAGDTKISKAVVAKTDCILGNHRHLHKDERFLLLSGRATLLRVGDDVAHGVEAPREFTVPRGAWHEIWLTAGSVLLCNASEPHDPADDHI